MAIQESAIPESLQAQSQLRFILAVIDGCNESERALLQLVEVCSRPQNIQMFYAHRMAGHSATPGLPIGRLQVVFQYLEDLLGLDDSMSREYQEHMNAGRHVLLANVYCDSDAESVASVLGRVPSHAGHVLGYGHSTKPLPFTV
jgi:hypothetical protein